MYINGRGRCPFCLDFGKRDEMSFRCQKCEIIFDEFIVSSAEYPEYQDKYWN